MATKFVKPLDLNTKRFFFLIIVDSSGTNVFVKKLNNQLNCREEDFDYLAKPFVTLNIRSSTIVPPDIAQYHQKSEGFEELQDHQVNCIDCENFQVHMHTTLTNVTFLLITKPNESNISPIFDKIYKAYAKYVSRDPDYMGGQRIKNLLFDKEMTSIFTE